MTNLAEDEDLLRESLEGGRSEPTPDQTAVLPEATTAVAVRAAAPASSAPSYPLQFTGSGSEYFRIWIANLFLTVVTLGIYSAWAKVRKTRYFWQNTRLDGHVFDYHGNPVAVLRGRVLAVVLFAAYTWTLEFSQAAGLVTIGLLCLIGPWLFWKAQQFKSRNTSHRGLRFDFAGDCKDAYAALLPPLLIWFSGSVAGLLLADEPWITVIVVLATFLLFPWMHHRLKRYQHGRVCYGDQRAGFVAATEEFYWTYTKGLGVVVGMFILVFVVVSVLAVFARLHPQLPREFTWIVGLVVGGMLYLGLWPYFAARLQRVVWDNTQLGALHFRTTLAATTLFGLVAACVFWTVLTLGLYWPFAAIRLARYRVQCMHIVTGLPLDRIAYSLAPTATPAAGDSAAELFGLDVGL